jgi:hypothetical protein
MGVQGGGERVFSTFCDLLDQPGPVFSVFLRTFTLQEAVSGHDDPPDLQ